MKTAFTIVTLSVFLAQPVFAAQDQGGTDGFDFDTLAACSVVYQRIGELYAEKGDATQSEDFQNTSYAYSSAAFYMLQYQTDDQASAYSYSEDRLKLVVESLNTSSSASEDGDMGVINAWLPYCDTLGQGVGELVDRRASEGW